ncbi:uncharacterized protein B0H64DRAFT_397612 [Chaetomium fimeti]|uniref:Uncharacterized protein n=1 Tax=Chaetomium fimeti TaxID=1854472 RepID=A0AAE0HH35_9PEZI|nr:hypothetical protein B0H64DRAFT_397612 [Chaetomium fimeti]
MNGRLLLLAALAAAATGQECDYYSNNHCLKSPETVSTTVPFTPLFSAAPTFVYGVDELDSNDIETARDKDMFSIPAAYSGPVLKVAWWLEYDNKTVNLDRAQNRHYYAFAMETSSTNGVGGGANGCADLLGTECVRNLKEVVASRTFAASYVLGGMGYVMGQLAERPLRNLSCPEDIFGNTPSSLSAIQDAQLPLYLDGFDEFATIRDDGLITTPPPPGNASFTHVSGQFRYRTLEAHRAQGLVAVTVSWPAVDAVVGEPLNYTMDDVTVETACLRLGAAGGTGGGNGGGGENAAPRYRVGGGLVVAVVGALVIML